VHVWSMDCFCQWQGFCTWCSPYLLHSMPKLLSTLHQVQGYTQQWPKLRYPSSMSLSNYSLLWITPWTWFNQKILGHSPLRTFERIGNMIPALYKQNLTLHTCTPSDLKM
jgi:hypothetical protein